MFVSKVGWVMGGACCCCFGEMGVLLLGAWLKEEGVWLCVGGSGCLGGEDERRGAS